MVKIDTAQMSQGKEVAARLGMPEGSGIPWMVILDSAGDSLITSDGPKGNVGYPFEPHEIEHFIAMLRQTARRLTAEQIGELQTRLEKYAQEKRAAREPEAARDQSAADRAALAKSLDAARRAGWELAQQVVGAIEQRTDLAAFPGIQAFVADMRSTGKEIDASKPHADRQFDIDKLVTQNPNFWRATYE